MWTASAERSDSTVTSFFRCEYMCVYATAPFICIFKYIYITYLPFFRWAATSFAAGHFKCDNFTPNATTTATTMTADNCAAANHYTVCITFCTWLLPTHIQLLIILLLLSVILFVVVIIYVVCLFVRLISRQKSSNSTSLRLAEWW